VHLDIIKSRLLYNGCTIKYSKKNVKIYIKINIKMLLYMFRSKMTIIRERSVCVSLNL